MRASSRVASAMGLTMPWSDKTKKLAQAVAHGFKPTGSAKGFDRGFAEQVLEESGEEKKRRKKAEDMLGKGAHAALKKNY